MKLLSPSKAKKILDEGKIRGRKLTSKQIAFFRLIASGKVPTRLNDIPVKLRSGIAA